MKVVCWSESIKGVVFLRCFIRILTAGMTHQTERSLTEKDVGEIVEDLIKELTEASKYLEKGVLEGDRPLSNKIFNLELGVVSPLYYRLQRHLIDWGSRRRHQHSFGERLKLFDGKKFNE